jgi:hypothetical protein
MRTSLPESSAFDGACDVCDVCDDQVVFDDRVDQVVFDDRVGRAVPGSGLCPGVFFRRTLPWR